MKKIKILTIFGTRPEAIKMAPVVTALNQCPHIQSVVCITAQHREMLDQVLARFAITPQYDLNLMTHGQTITDITVGVLTGLRDVLATEKPDMVLVHGDTSTTFAGALAAFYAGVPVGHVEAGLRTYDKTQPFPEEMNRVLTTHLTGLHFAPTRLSKENLLKENVPDEDILVTGNTAVDCVKLAVFADYRFQMEALNTIDFKSNRVIVMTAHRRENWGQPLADICHGVRAVVDAHPDVALVYAVHQNPVVKDTAQAILGDHPRILLTPPLDLYDMYNLIGQSYMVLTDSGGLQEEAPGLAKPVLVLRNVTERPEGLAAGTLKLCGNTYEGVVNHARSLLNDQALYEAMCQAKNPFGDGFAAGRIVQGILHRFGISPDKPEDFD